MSEIWLPLATLVVVSVYTFLTRRIQLAAQEQAEAPQKPVIVLQTVPRDAQDQILDHTSTDGAAALRVGQAAGNLVLTNIGAGVAIDIRYEFKFDGLQKSRARRVPYLQYKDTLLAPITVTTARSENLEFVATYKSLSGKRYITKMTVRDLVVENCTFEPL